MIISEKQITNLIQVAQLYLRMLDKLSNMDDSLLSNCGKHNKIHIANLLQEINNQQCSKLMVIE